MKKAIPVALSALVLGSPVSQAEVSDAQFEQLKAQFGAMAARLSALEAENARLREVGQTTITDLAVAREDLNQVQQHQDASSWSERIKVKGDFRYRYEEIDVEDADTRERNRIRARAAIVAKLPKDVEVGLGVASGGDDPVSSNQTLGGGGSTKDIRLDLAYFKWQATEELFLTGGKFKNTYYRPQKTALLWDGDYNPEGLGAGWKGDMFFATVAGNWLESDSRKNNKQFSWGAQGGVTIPLGGAKLVAGVGYFDLKTKGKGSFFGDSDDFFGNSFECSDPDDLGTCVYKFNYEEVELFADLSFNLFDMPVALFVDYVQNQDADDNDTGYLVGARLGKASKAGSWNLGYQYQDLEADAALGLLSDSDFAGGGTDGKGHRLSGAYAITKQWNVAFTWFINNEAGEVNLRESLDYDRFMIDTNFKY